jgi:hypothetical protein
LQTNISGIDQVLEDMVGADMGTRLNAHETLEKLGRVVNAMPPTSLLIEPEILRNRYY